ncbi:MAG: LacI family DNA-binding transcriptional regulator [Longimonas sp.]|uniref:LacI family DNA-binding transcriptional regulator n=1 Tax=Longimonas sp. TaxID=2039626 RepID=UPI0033586060
MAATIYDIAERADVSTATVSRVLNKPAEVSETTRQRVLDAAQELNYQPHASAQNLARQRTNYIAVVAPVVANYFYMHVMRGIQEVLADREYDLMIHVPSHPEDIEKRLQRATQPGRSDGILLLSTPPNESWAQRIIEVGRPIILLDAHHPDIESIAVDNERGGYKATKHLIDQGYKRIAHITATPEPPPAVQRRIGYERALKKAGREVDDRLIAASEALPFAFSEEGGYRAMKQLLGQRQRPDAVFAASDMQAVGALEAAREAGLSVPGDLAIVGFDDTDISRFAGLTTLRQPAEAMGRRAAESLLRHIQGANPPVSSTVLAPQLIVRDTCGARQQSPNEAGKLADAAAKTASQNGTLTEKQDSSQ